MLYTDRLNHVFQSLIERLRSGDPRTWSLLNILLGLYVVLQPFLIHYARDLK